MPTDAVGSSLVGDEGMINEPVSPTGQYFNSTSLSVMVLCMFEIEVPIDDSPAMDMLTNVFLPITPRFSSIMVEDENGVKRWKRVEVKLEEHVHVPIFPEGLPPESYEQHFKDYLSEIAMAKLPQSRPLWDVHIVKYPTSARSAGAVVIRLHHAMGDGFSLMGALFSCLTRADDPSLPLTFPSASSAKSRRPEVGVVSGILGKGRRLLSAISNTASDVAFSLLKSSIAEDDRSAVRSATPGVEFLPVAIDTAAFSLDRIRQVKDKLNATVNDVTAGLVFYGVRLYLERTGGVGDAGHSRANLTALVLLNTRMISGYLSPEEMKNPKSHSPWGNQFGFLHISVPQLLPGTTVNPLHFVSMAKEIIQRKRRSMAVYLTGQLLETLRIIKGPEGSASFMHKTLSNSSMTISNLIGPSEKFSLAGHPCSGLSFMVVGVPQSLTITMVSYNGELRMAVGVEKGFIDSKLLISCMEQAFARIFEAAVGEPLLENGSR